MKNQAAGLQIALVDGGGTNIGSVAYALERLGATSRLTDDPDVIRSADRVILPGVGAAAPGMQRLREAGLVEVLRNLEQPLLGVCLGMQLLYDRSAEDGGVPCLGLIDGSVEPIPATDGARVPHMGWNTLTRNGAAAADPLISGIHDGDRAYFVHSFAAPVTADTLLVTRHGGTWTAVVRHGNRWGAQFHPERSADVGARFLRNFLVEVT